MRNVIVLLLLSLLALTGCGGMSVKNPTSVHDIPNISSLDQEYLVQVGDTIRVTLRNFDDPNHDVTEVPVRPDGRVFVPLLKEEILVAGYTPNEIRQNLIGQFSELIKQPILSVNIVSFAPRSVYVGGEINTVPDEMPFMRDMTALRAVARTGWNTTRANLNKVVVIRRQSNGNAPIVMQLRLLDAIRNIDSAQDIALMPNDIVVVPPKGIVVAGDYIAHINNLVPLPGLVYGIGAAYALDHVIEDDEPRSTTTTIPGLTSTTTTRTTGGVGGPTESTTTTYTPPSTSTTSNNY